MEKIELRIYELLGVRVFRFLVFKLEMLIHSKDKGRNDNYHITAYDPMSVDGFIKHLFYNGAIHVRNALFMIVIFFVRYLVFKACSKFDILLWLFFVKDCYCIMLQRYNYLRIKLRKETLLNKRNKLIEREAAKIDVSVIENYSQTKMAQDLMLVRRLRNGISGKHSVVLSADDVETLNRLVKLNESRLKNITSEGK